MRQFHQLQLLTRSRKKVRQKLMLMQYRLPRLRHHLL
ncbi:unnamed protein product, partial [Amoebophrya sp. A120]|eukprot:GSA120T00004465001.1